MPSCFASFVSCYVPAVSLRDDVKQYLPELLPNFTKLFEEAERTGRRGR